jgi:hypothetical protein
MCTRFRTVGPLLVLAGLHLLFAPPALAQETEANAAAREAAEVWMASLAAGEYQSSWEEAGEMFRASTTAEAWAEQAAAGHQRIGDLVGRELVGLRAVADPPGVPAGDYVHIRYRSEFTVIGPAVETVIVTKEAERGWRVIGYFVQPPSPG